MYSALFIDASNFYWRNFQEFDKPIVSEAGAISHGTLYSLNKSLSRIEREFPAENVFFLFDNPQSKIAQRKTLDSIYKSDREDKPKYAYDTFDLWKSVLKLTSDKYRICYKPGCEADDLVYPLLKLRSDDVLLISADLDWARSINNTVFWYDFKIVYDRHKFKDKYKFDPVGNSIKMYKALRGDPSDCVPVGCPRLPETILLRILENFTSIAVFYSELPNLSWIPNEWKLRLSECKARVTLNYKLVDFYDIDAKPAEFVFECTAQPAELDILKRKARLVTSYVLW